MIAALVDSATNIVVNIIVADARVDLPPDGYFLIDVENMNCGIGWIYDAAVIDFVDPNPSQQEG